MKSNKNISKLLFLIPVMVLTTLTGCNKKKQESSSISESSSQIEDLGEYYKTIDLSEEGKDLLNSLHTLNTQKTNKLIDYGSMPSYFSKTDPGDTKGSVRSFYSGKSASYQGNMNREHVWPASRTFLGRGNDPLEDDMHMVRPTLTSENSARGNKFFTTTGSGGWDPASFNNESYRGDAARIIFYCVVFETGYDIVDLSSDSTANHTMGKLSDLLKWNLEYPVADRENIRNVEVEKLQGNRNPFIDYPGFACKIWGDRNNETKRICGRS